MKRLAEWYLGVPQSAPGQGTAWSIGHRSPWPDSLPPWIVLILGAIIVAYVVFVYVRESATIPVKMRLVLIFLRIAAIAIVLLILSEFTLALDRTGLPFLCIMIDDSASMSLEDQYSQKELRSSAKAIVAEQSENSATRLNLAKGIMTRREGEWLKRLQEQHKLRVYRFSETAIPVGRSEYVDSAEIDDLVGLIKDLKATGSDTRPGPSLRKVLNDFRGTPPSAVIILTDGITSTTDADRLSTAVELALKKYVPVFPIGLGSEEPARDLQLYDTLVDEVAFVDDPITISTKLKSYGFEGKRVVVSLSDKRTKRELTKKQVRVGKDGEPKKVELTYTPRQKGEFDYVISVKALPNETNEQNNSEIRHINVHEEKISVLLVESVPRWEFRELKNLLEREKTIELHTVLQDADPKYSEQDRTAKPLNGRFPVKRSQINKYDVIVFGDVNLTHLSSTVLNHVRDFVLENGGGLLMIAGPNYNPASYRGTVLETMLPISLAELKVPPADMPITDAFFPELTLQGQKGSMIFRIAESETESLSAWKSLQGLYWMVEAPHRKPGSIVFAQHPTRTGSDGKLPVISMMRFGAGKVLFHATDETWRWRFRVGDAYYGRYWIQAIRYLSRSRLLGKSRTAELTSDRLIYPRGETVYLRVRFLDERHFPAEIDGVTVMVERHGSVQRPVKLTRLPEAPTVFEGKLRQAAEGSYHAWIAKPSFTEAPPSYDFRIEVPRRELQVRGLDRAELTKVAKLTRGKYYTIATADRVPSEIPTGQPVPLESVDPIPLWNRWELLLLFTMVVAGEWVLRKRYRLT